MILRRCRLWFVVLVGLVLAGGAWWWAIGTALSIRDANKITDGMTKAEVFAILGEPREPVPGYYWPGDRPAVWYFNYWNASDGLILITFGSDGLVNGRQILDAGVLRWQWRRAKHYLGL